jgi:hypothetical protein
MPPAPMGDPSASLYDFNSSRRVVRTSSY